MEIIVDAFLDALIDGVKMLPFLYLAYLLIEWLERNHGERIEKALAGGDHWGFVPGALLGCVPQCGFSAVAANFYASRVITPGTLLAVFLATSDEAIPLLAAEPTLWNKLGLLLVLKIVFGIAAGFFFPVAEIFGFGDGGRVHLAVLRQLNGFGFVLDRVYVRHIATVLDGNGNAVIFLRGFFHRGSRLRYRGLLSGGRFLNRCGLFLVGIFFGFVRIFGAFGSFAVVKCGVIHNLFALFVLSQILADNINANTDGCAQHNGNQMKFCHSNFSFRARATGPAAVWGGCAWNDWHNLKLVSV